MAVAATSIVEAQPLAADEADAGRAARRLRHGGSMLRMELDRWQSKWVSQYALCERLTMATTVIIRRNLEFSLQLSAFLSTQGFKVTLRSAI